MQANWSLILNVLLLIGVIVAIGRLMKSRRQSLSPERYQPALGTSERNLYDASHDDIIAVRKVNLEPALDNTTATTEFFNKPVDNSSQPRLIPDDEEYVALRTEPKAAPKMEMQAEAKVATPSTLMMFLVAKENRQFAGYELLQTVLAAGLRFGEGQLFHRHQYSNGQGSILCSLATATATGVFDLQNIGAFSVRGLCLYMHSSKNPDIDATRFAVMLETARQLSDGLDAHLLDEQRKPMNEERIAHYYHLLNIHHPDFEEAVV